MDGKSALKCSQTKSHENSSSACEKNRCFHTNEILPDYQTRMKNALAELRIVPDVVLDHIGLEEINGTNAKERYFIDFARNSSIHGLNHIVARRRHPVERILAVVFIGVCLMIHIYVSFSFWLRYQNKETVQSIDLNWQKFQVRKPSFLICPTNQTDESKFPATLERYDVEDTPETRSFFRFLSSVDYESMHKTPNFDAVPPEKWLPILHDLRNEFHFYFGETQNVTLHSVITERGICLSARNYKSIYVTFEYWMQDNWTVVPPPETVPFYYPEDNGNIEAIRVTTSGTVTMYYPGEVNEYQHKGPYVEPFQIVQYTVSIVKHVTSRKVMKLTVKQRKCKFSEDGGLEMWPVYTLNMCMMECRYQTIRQRCGCFPHFARPTAGVPICNAAQLRCIATIKDQLFLRKYMRARCNCLPNCNDDHYNLQKRNSALKDDIVRDHPVIWFSLIVKFPESLFRREEVFGFNDFLTAVGSAAGLFLGASVLSLIEVFYYVTLHMWVYYLKNKLTKKKQNGLKKFTNNNR